MEFQKLPKWLSYCMTAVALLFPAVVIVACIWAITEELEKGEVDWGVVGLWLFFTLPFLLSSFLIISPHVKRFNQLLSGQRGRRITIVLIFAYVAFRLAGYWIFKLL